LINIILKERGITMKKFISLVLAAAIALSCVFVFTSCGDETKTVTGKKDLEGAVIGVQRGTTGDELAKKYEKKGSTVERYNTGNDAVMALVQGKVDCVIIDNQPAKSYVKANKGTKILDEALQKEEYAICLKKGSKLTGKINSALKELKKDGTVDKILNNYTVDKDKGKNPYKSPKGVKRPNGELHMATNAAFEPYEYIKDKKIVGIDPDLAQAICDKLGYKLVIDDMEFDSIIASVSSGKSDFGMAGMTVTNERKKSVDFTDTYADANQVIIVKE
jgi:polar amino acid transport system substrate-binding protein